MKYLLSVLLLLSAAACAVASTTTISASNITDLNGRKIAAAKLCFLPVDAAGIAIGYRSGTAQIMPIKKCGQVSNGALQSSFAVFDSSSTVPTNMRYHITLTPAFNTVNVIRDFGTTTITGSTWTLDTFDPDATVLPALYTASSTSGSFYVNGDLTFTGTLIGTVPVSTLSSSVSTVNGVSCSLGGSCTVTASNPYALTMLDGYGSATTFNGSAAQSINYLSTTEVGSQSVAGAVNFNNSISVSGSATSSFVSSSSTSFSSVVDFLMPNNAISGHTSQIRFGVKASDYNMGQLQFTFNGYGSTANYASIGLWGANSLLNVFGDGNVAIGSTSDCGYKLCVTGKIQVGGALIYEDGYTHLTGEGSSLNYLSLSAGTIVFRPTADGVTGVYILPSTGVITASGAVTGASWSATSDHREKHNIQTLDGRWALDHVRSLRAVTFDWNNPKADRQRQTGWIAQEVERAGMASSVSVKPGEIHHADGTTTKVDDFRSLKQNEMTAVLWAAVQEQQRQLNQLRRQFKHKGAR